MAASKNAGETDAEFTDPPDREGPAMARDLMGCSNMISDQLARSQRSPELRRERSRWRAVGREP